MSYFFVKNLKIFDGFYCGFCQLFLEIIIEKVET
jgi:hypothetical protein